MAEPADKIFRRALTGSIVHSTEQDAMASGGDAATTVEHVDFPCSVAQERFWLLDRLDPGSSSYNVAVRWRLEGRVATDLLQHAWQKIIERHEILKTVFVEVNGTPIQRVLATVPFKLSEIDLSKMLPGQQEAEGDRIGVIEARAPFDLGAGPLIRVTLLRFSPTVSIILVTTHQIVSDGWSIGVMAREMGIIYDALRTGQPVALDDLPIQYADYSLWQLEWLRVRGIETETAYWTKQLAGVKPFKIIPDRPRPAMPTTNGAIVSRVLPRELTGKAQAVSADRGTTLFASILAALCATLSRFTAQDEVVIGTQVSDRDQVELESMVGQFVNSLILRNSLAGNPRFDELIGSVGETSTLALEHRHIPIEKLLGMMKSDRNHANTAPISVNFIFQKTFIQNAQYADFALIDMPSLPAGAIYDLNFFMVERPDGWRFSCQYNTDQFENDTVVRLLDYFQQILESAVADPRRRVSELAMGAPGEVAGLLQQVNGRNASSPSAATLPEIFAAQVVRAPDAQAVSCGERQLSYRELDQSVNRLVHELRERRVIAGSTVGICLSRGIEVPVALLAILKSGCSFVVVDPGYGPVLRESLLSTARAVAVIVDHDGPTDGAFDAIDVRIAFKADTPAPMATLGHAAPIEGLACLLMTSGADRAPLVGLSHRTLANMIQSLAARLGLGQRDVTVAVSGIASGHTTVDMLLPLLTGGRLVLAQEKDMADGERLAHLLQRSGATVMQAAPEIWSLLAAAHWTAQPAMKLLCAAPLLPVGTLLALGGEAWGLYGHPESGIWSSVVQVKPNRPVNSLGKPLDGAQLYVLDSQLQPVPLCAAGELYIGGGIGELHRRDSAGDDSFVHSPVNASFPSPTKLYRTGDFARVTLKGEIEFLERRDDRFFAHGCRIDPTLVEDALLRHPALREAAVMHLTDVQGPRSLIAYVVCRDPPADGAALRAEVLAFLAQRLAPELQPASLEWRDHLPRTAGGTVDKRALAAREPVQQGGENSEPSGEIEQELSRIWASMLGLPSVPANAHFFELGGHSLLAARMLSQVERVFGRHIKLGALFAAPTITELAKLLSQKDPREFDFRQVVKIQPNGSETPLIGINNTGIYFGLAKSLGANQPVISLQLFDPSVTTAELPDTLEGIATAYVELIRRVQPQGPYQLMGWCVAGALAFEISRQLCTLGQPVKRLFLIDSWVPQYFKRQSLWRGVLGEYSLRWILILEDWQRFTSGRQSFRTFLENRIAVQTLRRWLHRSKPQNELARGQFKNPEEYDLWLLNYLQTLTARYQPKPIPVPITLLRSREEPTGFFFQPDAGWRKFTSKGVNLVFIDGNHFTMFKDPGVGQMARQIAGAIDVNEPRTNAADTESTRPQTT